MVMSKLVANCLTNLKGTFFYKKKKFSNKTFRRLINFFRLLKS
jgi:hypothetical protein